MRCCTPENSISQITIRVIMFRKLSILSRSVAVTTADHKVCVCGGGMAVGFGLRISSLLSQRLTIEMFNLICWQLPLFVDFFYFIFCHQTCLSLFMSPETTWLAFFNPSGSPHGVIVLTSKRKTNVEGTTNSHSLA